MSIVQLHNYMSIIVYNYTQSDEMGISPLRFAPVEMTQPCHLDQGRSPRGEISLHIVDNQENNRENHVYHSCQEHVET